MIKRLALWAMLAATVLGYGPAVAADKTSFKIGWAPYIGFMPLIYADQAGILKKWGDKYGVTVEMVQVNDYIGGMNQFVGDDMDAYSVAGMDALTIPAAGGVDTSIFLIFDYSNGNDVLLSKSAASIKDLSGQTIHLVQFSVSHYLLQRALTMNGFSGLASVKTVNLSDADIASAYLTTPEIEHVVSWKPMTDDMIKGLPSSKVLFDSSQTPGEIMDVLIARATTLQTSPGFAKAVTGAWYEALDVLARNDAATAKMNEIMAAGLGTDVPGMQAQLATTALFKTPSAAAEFLSAASTKTIWDQIRNFSFEQGLFGQGVASVDEIGIAFPDGSVLGSPANVKLRLDPSFTKMLADGTM